MTVYNSPYDNSIIIYYLKYEDSGIYECRKLNGQVMGKYKLKVHDTFDHPVIVDDTSSKPPYIEYPADDGNVYIPYSANYGKLNTQIELACGEPDGYNFVQPIEWIRLDGDRVHIFILCLETGLSGSNSKFLFLPELKM